MNPVRLIDLGSVSALRSQTVYHAVAEAMEPDSPDTVILVSPSDPYVCIGYHQDLEQEVDLGRCDALGLPVYRREVGGGAVYLDQDQVFVQWIVHPDRVPGNLEQRYAAYIAPLVATYRDFGVDARLRPINDVHVDGRKIGGTGAARIGDGLVLVGSLMFDFDRATMAQVLKVPSEKMRDKVYESLSQYMVTLADLVEVDRSAVIDRYVEHCATALGSPLETAGLTTKESQRLEEVDARFVDPSWLFDPRHHTKRSDVKIHAGVSVVEGAHKAPGGLVRVTARLRDGSIDDLDLSGDFTLLPADALGDLELAARGPLDGLEGRIEAIYATLQVDAPGMTPGDLALAIASVASPQE